MSINKKIFTNKEGFKRFSLMITQKEKILTDYHE